MFHLSAQESCASAEDGGLQSDLDEEDCSAQRALLAEVAAGLVSYMSYKANVAADGRFDTPRL